MSTSSPSGTASPASPAVLPRSVVLVDNPDAGHGKNGPEHACHALAHAALTVCAMVLMDDVEQLWPGSLAPTVSTPGSGGGRRRDNWRGAGYVANTDAILGILPLGTSNDIARSPDMPLRLADAVRLLTSGTLSTSDIVQFVDEDDGSTTFERRRHGTRPQRRA